MIYIRFKNYYLPLMQLLALLWANNSYSYEESVIKCQKESDIRLISLQYGENEGLPCKVVYISSEVTQQVVDEQQEESKEAKEESKELIAKVGSEGEGERESEKEATIQTETGQAIGKTLWSSETQSAYCERRAKEFTQRQREWGWDCIDPIALENEGDASQALQIEESRIENEIKEPE